MATPEATSRPVTDCEDDALRPPRRPTRAVLFRLLAVAVAVVGTLGTIEATFRIHSDQPLGDQYPKFYTTQMADEVLGWSYKPGARGQFVGPYPLPVTVRSDFRINSLGLRGPELTAVAPGGLRVLVLGDSVASGLEVADNETYSTVGAQLLSTRLGVPVQVINAGVRGYGTDQEWLLYRERLKQLHSDVVLDHTTENDPFDNLALHGMRQRFGKPAFVLGADNTLHLVGQPVPDYPPCSVYVAVAGVARRVDGAWDRLKCQLETSLLNHSACFSYVSQRMWMRDPSLVWTLSGPAPAPRGPGTPVPLEYALRLTSVLISRMADDVRRDGARFLLMGKDVDLERLDVAGFEREGIPLVRIGSAFGPDTLVPHDLMHPNAAGHRRIGELLADQIEPLLREVLQERRDSR